MQKSNSYGVMLEVNHMMNLNKLSRMALASGSRLLLQGIRKILEYEKDLKVVAEISDSKDIPKCLHILKPEFLFLDNRIPNLHIFKLLNFMKKNSLDTKVILFGDETSKVFNFSNVIYITKETDSSELIRIIKSTNKLIPTKTTTNTNVVKRNITRMEKKVAELIEEGLTNKEISNILLIREKTVKAHITNIFRKLGFHSRYQLIVMKGRQLKHITG